MSETMLGEIRIFSGTFAPDGWAFCDGQSLSTDEHSALFSIIDYTYGGGGNTFNLPNLRGRVPIHAGQGSGLSNRPLGETGGDSEIALSDESMPTHSHRLNVVDNSATQTSPINGTFAKAEDSFYAHPTPAVEMGDGQVVNTGQGDSHNNMQPYLTLHFIIALTGIFPSRVQPTG